MDVDVWDPQADAEAALSEYGVTLVEPEVGAYDAVILAVSHKEFRAMSSSDVRALGKEKCVIFDVKGALDRSIVDGRL